MRLLASALLFASAALAQGTCNQSNAPIPITATGRQTAYANKGPACTSWSLTYWSTGVSGLSIEIDSAQDSSGAAGSWSAVSVTPVLGTNPSTALSGAVVLQFYAPWVSVNVTSLTGTGQVYYILSGTSGAGQIASGGGGSSSVTGASSSVTTAGTPTLSIAQTGTTGSQTIYYSIACHLSNGTVTANSGPLASDITTSNGNLTASNFNTVTPSCPSGSTTYDLYRWPLNGGTFTGVTGQSGEIAQGVGISTPTSDTGLPIITGTFSAPVNAAAIVVNQPSQVPPNLIKSASLVSWFQAALYALVEGATAGNVTDSLGVTYTAAGSPVYRATRSGGRPTIEFNGTSTKYSTSISITNGQSFTFSAVYCPYSLTGARILTGNASLSFYHQLSSQQQVYVLYNGSASSSSLGSVPFTCHSLILTSSASALTMYINGVQSGSSSIGLIPSGPINLTELGAGASSDFIYGNISDAEFYNGILSPSDITALANWQMNYYGINKQAPVSVTDSSGSVLSDGFGLASSADWVVFGDSVSSGGFGATNNGAMWSGLFGGASQSLIDTRAVAAQECADTGITDNVYLYHVSAGTEASIGSHVFFNSLGNDAYANGMSQGGAWTFQQCHLALLAYLSIPDTLKAFPALTPPTLVTSGTWVADTHWPALGLKTVTSSSSITYSPVTGGNTCMMAFALINGGTGTFTVSIDGVAYGSYSASGNTTTVAGRTYSPGIAIWSNLGYRVHTIVITQTAGEVDPTWFACTGNAAGPTGPLVLSGTTEQQANYSNIGTGFDNGSAAAVAMYAEIVRRNVSTLTAAGLAVKAIDVTTCYLPAIHPTNIQHAALAECTKRAANTHTDFSYALDPMRTINRIGVPFISTANAASISSTNIDPAALPGLYRVTLSAQTVTAATGGSGCSLAGTVTYTDRLGNSHTDTAFTGMSLAAVADASAELSVWNMSATPVSFAFTVTAGTCTGFSFDAQEITAQ